MAKLKGAYNGPGAHEEFKIILVAKLASRREENPQVLDLQPNDFGRRVAEGPAPAIFSKVFPTPLRVI